MSYNSNIQNKNIAWCLPRPKNNYKGSMPLYCEKWLIALAKDILQNQNASILNVFCGTNKLGLKVDIRKEVNPDIIADIHFLTLHSKMKNRKFDIILADPPYSNKESKELYDTPNIYYTLWTSQCIQLLTKNGLLIIYHKYIVPNPNFLKLKIVKRVFIGSRIFHIPRVAIYFKRYK